MEKYINQNGKISFLGEVDHEGNPVERSKQHYPYPYPYSSFVTFDKRKKKDKVNFIYSDRMMQQDFEKFNKVVTTILGKTTHYFYGTPSSKMEAIFQEFHNEPNVKLVLLMEGCNVSSGYPFWVFGVTYD